MSKNQTVDGRHNLVDFTSRKWMTPKDFEAEFGITTGTQANWRCRKIGPKYHKLGARKVAYLRSDVEAWATSNPVLTRDSIE